MQGYCSMHLIINRERQMCILIHNQIRQITQFGFSKKGKDLFELKQAVNCPVPYHLVFPHCMGFVAWNKISESRDLNVNVSVHLAL